jgi:hypothetical protein
MVSGQLLECTTSAHHRHKENQQNEIGLQSLSLADYRNPAPDLADHVEVLGALQHFPADTGDSTARRRRSALDVDAASRSWSWVTTVDGGRVWPWWYACVPSRDEAAVNLNFDVEP